MAHLINLGHVASILVYLRLVQVAPDASLKLIESLVRCMFITIEINSQVVLCVGRSGRLQSHRRLQDALLARMRILQHLVQDVLTDRTQDGGGSLQVFG